MTCILALNQQSDECHFAEQNTSMKKKKMTILFPEEKCVPDHDGRFINRCQVRLCEDSQVYIPSSTLPALQYKKTLPNF
jgi:hypothetical protein